MRDAMRTLGGDPSKINPLSPVELVIDHSLQVDRFGSHGALARNTEIEFERNRERYAFLRWGQKAFRDFKVVPPGMGIVHQINLEYLARVVFAREHDGATRAYPDTVVGTDSHTTMVNGLGVLGWGVGGIEAEAAMLGQPISMLIPQVVGFELTGKLPEGATATDLVLTVVQMLRAKGVVGKFVEFFGDGLDHMPLADRATIANMAPEYGATCGIFPIDAESIAYLRLSGRPESQIALVEAYARAQGLFREPGDRAARYSDTLALDMGTVEPCISGPKRPQDRITLREAKTVVTGHLETMQEERGSGAGSVTVESGGASYELRDGAVVIAAITSCTNTSNPAVLVGAGLLARNARERGLVVQPWVKTSFAPGSMVVKDYLEKAGLLGDLEGLGFHIVGFGCTTCIGNSGPAAHGGQRRDPRRRPDRQRRPVRQPELRGTGSRRGPDELPRLTPARRRVRPCGAQRTSISTVSRSARTRMARRCICATSGRRATRFRRRSRPRSRRRCSARATTACSTATNDGRAWRSRPRTGSSGTPPPPTSRTRPTSTTCP